MKLATGLRRPSQRHGASSTAARSTGPLKITGMAFQSSSLLPWRTTLDNVLLPLEIVEPYRSTFRRDRAAFAAKARAAARERRPRRLRGQVPVGALGRHAAARLDLPRAHPRAEDAAARRAVRRARRVHARGAVVHPARPAGGAALQRDPRHPRPARGGVPRRHRLRDEQAAPAACWCGARSTLPRPRDLEVTYTEEFTDIVHELREHIGVDPASPSAPTAAAARHDPAPARALGAVAAARR